MTTWHRAGIKFQYSPKQDTNHRAITSVPTQIYGNTESAVLQRLKEMYRSWTDFVILEIDWQTWRWWLGRKALEPKSSTQPAELDLSFLVPMCVGSLRD